MTSDNVTPAGRAKAGRAARSAQERMRWLAQLSGGSGTFEDQAVECYRCGRPFARRELAEIAELPGYRWPRYCSSCVEEIRQAHTHRCVLCGTCYMTDMEGESDGLCPDCSSPERLHELGRVRSHLGRARAAGLPATLTLGEWLAAVAYFGGLCAYCRAAPFTDLDHFVPLAAGGGTTAENCVPACARCNSAKSTSHPDGTLTSGTALAGGAEAIERVRAYLLLAPEKGR